MTTLPPPNSPHIHLTPATPGETLQRLNVNSPTWRGPLTHPAYLRRESHLAAQPLTINNGLTPWVLVYQPPETPPEQRTVLCGCESIRKRGLVKGKGVGGEGVREVWAHGVASVFTAEGMRGRGYAGRMMEMLGERLETWQGESAFSVLYSDIGKRFYAGRGWGWRESAHVGLRPGEGGWGVGVGVREVRKGDLEALCEVDGRMVRERMGRLEGGAVALVPDWETVGWHHAREEFVGEELFGRVPEVKGAMVGEEGERVWCYWTRVWAAPGGEEVSMLHILRLVVEDEAEADFAPADVGRAAELVGSEAAKKTAAVLAAAQAEAARWEMAEVQLWNPSSLTMAAAQMVEPGVQVVHREEDSIASLRWYGEGEGEDMQWVCNEKFGWC